MRGSRWVAALAAVVALGACGGASDEGSGVSIGEIASSGDVTKEAETAGISLEVSIPGDDGGSATAEGVVDFESGEGTMTMTVEEPGKAAEEFELRVVDGMAYARLPEAERDEIGVDTEWVRTPLDQLGGLPGLSDFSSMADVTGTLEMLEQLGDVEDVGREEIRGVDTTHFSADLDLMDAANAGEESEEAMGLAFLVMFTGGRPIPIDVWVDDDNRVRRFSLSIDLAGMAEMFGGMEGAESDEPLPENLEFTMVTELFDFGTEIDVEPPPAADTSDMPGFMDPALQTGPVPCMDDVKAAIAAYKAQHGEDAQPTTQDLLDAGLLESVNGVSLTWGDGSEGISIIGEDESC